MEEALRLLRQHTQSLEIYEDDGPLTKALEALALLPIHVQVQKMLEAVNATVIRYPCVCDYAIQVDGRVFVGMEDTEDELFFVEQLVLFG